MNRNLKVVSCQSCISLYIPGTKKSRLGIFTTSYYSEEMEGVVLVFAVWGFGGFLKILLINWLGFFRWVRVDFFPAHVVILILPETVFEIIKFPAVYFGFIN